VGCRGPETAVHFVGDTFGGSTLERKKLPIAIASNPARNTVLPFLTRIDLLRTADVNIAATFLSKQLPARACAAVAKESMRWNNQRMRYATTFLLTCLLTVPAAAQSPRATLAPTGTLRAAIEKFVAEVRASGFIKSSIERARLTGVDVASGKKR